MTLTGRGRPSSKGRRAGRIAVRVLGLVLGLAALGSGEHHRVFAQSQTPSGSGSARPRAPLIVHKDKRFKIPFNILPEDRPLLAEIQLWASDDKGFHWKKKALTTPNRPAFEFEATRDGEYWFAVRTLDKNGQLYPTPDKEVEPSLRVVVDTVPPSLVIEQENRRGSQESVRWEVRDEHIDMKSFRIEYQVLGARDWRNVPIRRLSSIGSESWDAGSAEPLKVRASIADKAGNVAEAELNVPEGLPASTGLAANESADMASPSAIDRISDGSLLPPPTDGSASGTSDQGSPGSNPNPDDPFNLRGSPPRSSSNANLASMTGDSAPPAAAAPMPGSTEPNPFPSPNPAPGNTPAPPPGAAGSTILVGSPRFPLEYAVEDAGPSGPAIVELWVTVDGGRTWHRRGEDPNRMSPIDVDLGGEGTFGLRTVARAASGLGDLPPVNGDPPHAWVEVDVTPPNVKLTKVEVGTGANAGKVAIQWTASDAHLGPKPVQILWRAADTPGAQWLPVTEAIENSGQFVWNVPMDVPQRFYLRVDAVDSVGNRNYAESTQNGPVIVDRTRPKSRIIGLDPKFRSGMGPNSRPLR